MHPTTQFVFHRTNNNYYNKLNSLNRQRFIVVITHCCGTHVHCRHASWTPTAAWPKVPSWHHGILLPFSRGLEFSISWQTAQVANPFILRCNYKRHNLRFIPASLLIQDRTKFQKIFICVSERLNNVEKKTVLLPTVNFTITVQVWSL